MGFLDAGSDLPFDVFLAGEGLKGFVEFGLGDDDDAVCVADDDVARVADDVAAGDGFADVTGAVFGGTGRYNAAGEHGQAHVVHFFNVADGAVDDDAGDAFAEADLGEDAAEDGPVGDAVSGDDEHVAGFGFVEAAVDGEVVAFPDLDGQGSCRPGGRRG